MVEPLIRPIVAQTLKLPEDSIGVVSGLNCTLIFIKSDYQLIQDDRAKVTQALHDALDIAFIPLGLIRFL